MNYLITLVAGDSTREICYGLHHNGSPTIKVEESDWDFPVETQIQRATVEAGGRQLIQMSGTDYLALDASDGFIEDMLHSITGGRSPEDALAVALIAAAASG